MFQRGLLRIYAKLIKRLLVDYCTMEWWLMVGVTDGKGSAGGAVYGLQFTVYGWALPRRWVVQGSELRSEGYPQMSQMSTDADCGRFFYLCSSVSSVEKCYWS